MTLRRTICLILAVITIMLISTTAAMAKTYMVPTRANRFSVTYKDGKLHTIKNKENGAVVTHTYYYKGNKVEVAEKVDKAGVCTEMITKGIDLDKKGRPVKLKFYDDQMNIASYTTYKYNSKGKIVKLSGKANNSSLKWKGTFKYDKKGSLKAGSFKTYSFNKRIGQNKVKFINKYKNGRLSKRTEKLITKVNGKWKCTNKVTTKVLYGKIKASSKQYKQLKPWIDFVNNYYQFDIGFVF